MYHINSINEPRRIQDTNGRITLITVTLHIRAPTKKGSDWSLYVGELYLRPGGNANFKITHVNSSAWGKSSYRATPFDYSRPDIEAFVLKDCAQMIADLVASMTTPDTQGHVQS